MFDCTDKEAILALLVEHGGNTTGASRAAGVTHGKMRYWIETHGLLDQLAEVRRGAAVSGKDGQMQPPEPKKAQPAEIIRLEQKVMRLQSRDKQRDKLLKHLMGADDIARSIVAAVVPRLDEYVMPEVKPPPVPKADHRNITLQVAINDVHWGKVFDADMIGDINAYSPTIAARRMQKVTDTVYAWVQNYERMGIPVEKIVMPTIGDNINGELHPEDEDNYAGIMTQAIDFALVHAQMVYEMATMVPQVDIIVSAGDNHSRLTKKSATSAKAFTTTVNTCYAQYLAALLVNVPNVKVHIDRAHQTYYTIYGRTWGACHGNLLKGGGGQLGIPAYGMARHQYGSLAQTTMLAKREMIDLQFGDKVSPTERLTRLHNALEGIVDHTLVGHFHTRQILEFAAGDLYVAPSAMGPDPYAVDALRKPGSVARQIGWAIHPEHDIINDLVFHLQGLMSNDEQSRYHWGIEQNDQNMAEMMRTWIGRLDIG